MHVVPKQQNSRSYEQLTYQPPGWIRDKGKSQKLQKTRDSSWDKDKNDVSYMEVGTLLKFVLWEEQQKE